MEQLLLMVFGPALLGLVGAIALWAVRRRRRPSAAVGGAVRGWTLAAVVAASTLVLARLLLGTPLVGFPLRSPTALMMTTFTVPLAAGVLAAVLLAVPVVRRTGTGTAELRRRTLTSFASQWWFVALGGTALLAVSVAVWAGTASVPDEHGRYTMYWIDHGTSSMGTTMYGWYFSRPALVLVALLVITALAVVGLISRPPPAHRREDDDAVRRWRTRTVMAMTTGAVLLHLASVVGSLAGTAGLHGGTQTDQGWFTVWTPFAALEGPLRVASDALEAGGWFLWFSVLLATAMRPSRRGDPANRASASS